MTAAVEGAGATDSRAAGEGHVSTPMMIGWSGGAACTAMTVQMFGQFLMIFLTSRLGMAPALAGSLIGINKFLGIFIDPVIGHLSDRTKSKMGRRRPWILAGAILLPLSVVVMFCPPTSLVATGPQTAYYTGAILLFGVAYSIFRIPFLTMAAEMTTDVQVRAKMISFKIIAIALGTLLGTSLVPALIDLFGSDRASYGKAGLVVTVLGLGLGLACFFSTAKARFAVREKPAGPKASLLKSFTSFISNRPFAALVGAKLLYFFGNTFKVSCSAYFIIYVMQARVGVLALFSLVLTLTTMASQPLWLRMVKALGKRMTFVISVSMWAVINMAWLLVAEAPSTAGVVAIAFGLGVGAGGVQLALESLLPDIMELDAHRTGLRREGAFAAVFSLMEKLTSAMAILLVGAFLQMSGFVQSTKDVVQPDSAVHAIAMAMTAIPTSTALASALIIFLWGLRRNELAEAVAAKETR